MKRKLTLLAAVVCICGGGGDKAQAQLIIDVYPSQDNPTNQTLWIFSGTSSHSTQTGPMVYPNLRIHLPSSRHLAVHLQQQQPLRRQQSQQPDALPFFLVCQLQYRRQKLGVVQNSRRRQNQHHLCRQRHQHPHYHHRQRQPNHRQLLDE